MRVDGARGCCAQMMGVDVVPLFQCRDGKKNTTARAACLFPAYSFVAGMAADVRNTHGHATSPFSPVTAVVFFWVEYSVHYRYRPSQFFWAIPIFWDHPKSF
jgi:hypothetical protein